MDSTTQHHTSHRQREIESRGKVTSANTSRDVHVSIQALDTKPAREDVSLERRESRDDISGAGHSIQQCTTNSDEQPLTHVSSESSKPLPQLAAPCINEETETVVQAEVSYADFPTHVNLRQANEKWALRQAGNVPRSNEGSLKPFPSSKRKSDLFDAKKFDQLDKYADMVCSSPISEVSFCQIKRN